MFSMIYVWNIVIQRAHFILEQNKKKSSSNKLDLGIADISIVVFRTILYYNINDANFSFEKSLNKTLAQVYWEVFQVFNYLIEK
jgi:hypothetical protein